MIAYLGKINQLKIVKFVDFGLYLDGYQFGEILMPKRYVHQDFKVDDIIDVMVYLDGEERYLATTETPYAQIEEFAFLRVNKVESIGAFLDWGLSKELFVPFSEQKVEMQEGKKYVVYVYLDKITDRIVGSMKLEKFLKNHTDELKEKDEVQLLIWTKSDLGYKAIINNKYLGIIYHNEIFENIMMGQNSIGYIKKIRPDGKIDLSLTKSGHTKIDDQAKSILQLLRSSNGSLPYHDKTAPEIIYQIFGMSKKDFKKSIGNLYKNKIIDLSEKGITINKEFTKN